MLFRLDLACWVILVIWLVINSIHGSREYRVCLKGGKRLKTIAKKFGLEHNDNASIELSLDEDDDILQAKMKSKPFKVHVDFTSDRLTWRTRSGKKEALAIAVGVRKNYHPYVIDATGGFGTDAYIITSHGCKVKVFEKHPIVASLLENGIQRAAEVMTDDFKEKLHFQFGDSLAYLRSLNRSDINQTGIPDVIYLDPMFPKSKNTALVRKNLQFLQSVLTPDPSNDKALMEVALKTARKRVVVKRPLAAPFLGGRETKYTVKAKRYRFDFYNTELKAVIGKPWQW